MTGDPLLDSRFGRLFAPREPVLLRLGKRLAPALLALSVLAMVPTAAEPAMKPTPAFLKAKKAIGAPAGFGNLCGKYDWLCTSTGGKVLASHGDLDLATRINGDVNRKTRQISDVQQYGRSEYWALPTARGGDCEDFALLKKMKLVAGGVRPETLLVATVLDRKRNPHAVLVMRTEFGDVVLDNLSSRVKHWSETGYSFLKMQNPARPANWDAIFTGGIFGNKA
jgi:predicted transglutaminase-like cysteine proteinase